MSAFIEHIAHEECGSSDALAVYADNEGGFSGYCWSCDTYVQDPYGDNPPKDKSPKKKTEEEIQQEINEIGELPVVDVPSRQLRASSLDHYGIKVGLSEQDGRTPVLRYYPYTKDGVITGYKVKLDTPEGKKMWVVGSLGSELFGWQQALRTGAKKLFITEGEDDAAALHQALRDKQAGTKWAEYVPAVVSLTRGAASAKRDLSEHLPAIRANFKEVILVFDQDEAGRQAAEDAATIYPTACSVTIPGKDANDCVINGRSMALASAVLFKASVAKNTRLVSASDLYDAGRAQPEPGLSWPWQGLTSLTRGIRMGETVYLGAGVKMGKSEVVNTLAAHLMVEHDLPVFLAKPEEANAKTMKMVCGKVAGKFFHDPNIAFDGAAYDVAYGKVKDKLIMLSLYQHMGWDSLRADIMAAAAMGCKAIFIDPITNLTNGINSGDANTKLQEIAQELAAMAKDLDIVIFIFCHLKAPDYGDPHERGGKVLSHQFAGSRAMMRSCNLMLGLEGNKDPDMEDEARNMRKLVILEDREFGASGFIRLYWDNQTSLFNEVK